MIKFLNPHDAVILSEMIAHGENTFGVADFWTKRGMLGPLIRRAMSMPHIEVTLSTRIAGRHDHKDSGNKYLPKEIDFVWHIISHYDNEPESPALYASTFNDWCKFDELDKTAEKKRAMNGAWVNHGSDNEPNWGSHT